jgi:cobaltochelatase CobN
VETIRKGNWDTDQATKTKLLTEYIESIKQHGVGCSEVSCGNARLLEYILDEAKAAKIPSADIQHAKAALEQQLGMDISAAARVLKTFAKTNDTRTAKEVAEGREVLDNKADAEKLETVDGFVMEARDQSQKENAPDRPEVAMSVWSLAWPPLAVLCLMIAWFFFPTARRHG